MHRALVALPLLALASVPTPALAEDWQSTMAFYIFGAGLDGTTAVGPVETQIDQSFSEILEHLDVGLMGSYSAKRDEVTVTLDGLYVELGAGSDVTHSAGTVGLRFEAEETQTILAFDVGYLVTERLELLGGVRYNSLDTEIKITTGLGARTSVSDDRDWFDPYVGVRTTLPFNDAWSLTLRADVGGFDVGSKLAWQALARLNWSFSPTFFASVGYRILDTDYEDGSGRDFFRYDVTMSGPLAGIAWRF